MLKTEARYTQTASGKVEHYRLRGISMPVKILTTPFGERQVPRLENGLPIPVIKRGRYVYALPGGGDFTS